MEATNSVNATIKTRFNNFTKDAKTKAHKVRSGAINLAKNYNTVKDTTTGAARGAAEGAAAIAVVGLLGKNIKNAKGQIGKTLTGIVVDSAKSTVGLVKSIPSVITKAPIQNVKTILNAPVKFYGTYLKGNPITAFAATAVGLGILGLRTIQGKMTANVHNSNIDHAAQTGHAAVTKTSEVKIETPKEQ